MSIKIILADDHQLFREGLRALLEEESDMEVLAEAENGRTAVELTSQVHPDVVVMDISMPDLNGMEAARQIAQREPKTKVVALSMHSDKRFVEGMLKAGASGYLLKDSTHEELVQAIRVAVAGQTYLSPAVVGRVVDSYTHRGRSAGDVGIETLTAREREVLQLITEGHSTKQAAAQLHISVKTAETHRQQVMNKLNIHSLAELTKFAIRQGITSLEE